MLAAVGECTEMSGCCVGEKNAGKGRNLSVCL